MDKQEILSAIRRLAESNDGKPPGQLIFIKRTGSRANDWQRFWLRWGDAVREAGFEPNQLKSRLSDEHLLSHLAVLTRDLGHFPLSMELRMRARTSSGFPSSSTYRRLGGKARLAGALVRWCRANPGWDDVLTMSEPIADETANSVAETDDETDTGLQPGYVYLIRSGRYHKIGRTASPKRRFYELDTAMPHPVVQVHLISTDDSVGIERYWHNRFADRRVKGEWFRLTRGDIAVFRRREFM